MTELASREDWVEREREKERENVRERPADLFKSLAVGLTRVDSRKHTRFSLFRRGRLSSLSGGTAAAAAVAAVVAAATATSAAGSFHGSFSRVGQKASSRSWARSIRKDARARNARPTTGLVSSHVTRPQGCTKLRDWTVP